MPDPKIEPAKITKPIQLLAAWLAGLVLINGAFLTAASLIYSPTWAAGTLVVASVANVPLFLICLFLLQTKFRPEMQEDEFYQRYLEKRYSSLTGKSEVVEAKTSDPKAVSAADQSSQFPRYLHQRYFRYSGPVQFKLHDPRDYHVQINDLLPCFHPLLEDLISAGMKPTQTFGSTSNEPITPRKFVISIGEDVPLEVLKKILSVVRKYQPDGIAYTRNHLGMHHGNIYIGAYSYDDNSRPYLNLDEATIQKLLAPDASQETWDSLIPLDLETDVVKESSTH